MSTVNIDDVRSYWSKENIPQQWYSTKDYGSPQWFNELAVRRFKTYYPYLWNAAEFDAHRGEKVLEVGVGAGTDLIQYASFGAFVYGIDLGSDQVALTKQHFECLDLKYEEIIQASAENIPYGEEVFDVVYSFGVLHHTPNTNLAIGEIHRVLKGDGHAIVMLYARGWKHYLKRCFIHGILKGKIIKYNFNWQKVYDDVSEVNGGSPKSGVYTRVQVEEMFKDFSHVSIEKKRLGEFFEYKPYNTFQFPKIITFVFRMLKLEALIGENWLIKAYKNPPLPKGKVRDVIFKHY